MTTTTQKIPSGYKQTEIGVIPADWDVEPIKQLATITTGSKNTQDRISDGLYPFFVRSQTIERINSYSYDGEAILTAGDGVGTGKVFHYINGKFDIHQRVYKISDFNKKLNGYFFFLYFSNYFFNRIMQMTAKSSVDSVRMEMIADMQIPIPSETEQSAIATALIEADTLIKKLEKLIEKKKNIKQGVMQELLTGKRRLPGFSGKWEMKKLGEVAEFERGRDLPKSDMSDEGAYKCIHYGQLFREYQELVGEIKSKTNSNTGRFYSKSNDVLMPTSDVTPSGLATASCIKENGIILGGGILVIRFNAGYDGLYFSYFVSQNKTVILKLVKGSTVFHLYASDLANLEINFPGPDEQKAIASVLSDMDTEIEKLESQLTKYQNIKQGMMQTLLTGKIRLLTK